jgi:hypothetical protein
MLAAVVTSLADTVNVTDASPPTPFCTVRA